MGEKDDDAPFIVESKDIGITINGQRGLTVLQTLVNFPGLRISWILAPEGFIEDVKTSYLDLSGTMILPIQSAADLDSLDEVLPYVDFIVCAGFPFRIPTKLLKHARILGINCHGGKLPLYRGGSPIIWQIINDEKLLTMTIHELSSEFDQGDILLESEIPNPKNLYIRDIQLLVNLEFSSMIKRFFEDPSTYIKHKRAQNNQFAKYWHQRAESDGLIHWTDLIAFEVYNFVRAISQPYPGSFNFLYDGEIIRIWEVEVDALPICGAPGRIVKLTDGIHVVAKNQTSVRLIKFDCSRKIRNGEYLYRDKGGCNDSRHN